jgi:hypothetical protein
MLEMDGRDRFIVPRIKRCYIKKKAKYDFSNAYRR